MRDAYEPDALWYLTALRTRAGESAMALRLDSLPTAVLALILANLTVYERAHVACVCRKLRAAAEEADAVFDLRGHWLLYWDKHRAD